MAKPKRVVVISDLHCGHMSGLTPASFELNGPSPNKDQRKYIWGWFEKETKSLIGKTDVLIVNGDAVDGKGQASGGTEQIYMSYEQQMEMAAEVINRFKAPSVNMSFGTGYHTGQEEDWEAILAREVAAAKIGDEDNINVNGLVMNYKHHIGGSQVPHGRFTALARDVVWKYLWAVRGEYPLVDVVIRSHVHYHASVSAPGMLAMTMPALQGYGSKYARRLSGTVDIGFVTFEVEDKTNYSWRPHIVRMPFKPAREV